MDTVKSETTKKIIGIRKNKLEGKFVIISDGKNGEKLFLQNLYNSKIKSKGFWTKFLSNAKGFDSIEEANLKVSKFKFGNPRIAIVRGDELILVEDVEKC